MVNGFVKNLTAAALKSLVLRAQVGVRCDSDDVRSVFRNQALRDFFYLLGCLEPIHLRHLEVHHYQFVAFVLAVLVKASVICHLLEVLFHRFHPVESFVKLYLFLIVTVIRWKVFALFFILIEKWFSLIFLYLFKRFLNKLRLLLALLQVILEVLLFLKDLIKVKRSLLLRSNSIDSYYLT